MKIKIITTNYADSIQLQVDKFIEENPNVEIINCICSGSSHFDLYQGDKPTVCNTWQEFIYTIIYKIK